jgi:hypothetical protein
VLTYPHSLGPATATAVCSCTFGQLFLAACG